MVCGRCQDGQHHLCVAHAALGGLRSITWCDCQHAPRKRGQGRKTVKLKGRKK